MNNKSQFPRTHMGYAVSDIKKTIDFYTKFFQVDPVKTKPDYAKFILDTPSLNISFSQTSKMVKPNHIHFGIEVNNDEELKKHLGNAMNHALPIDQEKDVSCCYAKQDKFWVTDPDGYKWEVFLFKEDVKVNDEVSVDSECCTV